MIASQDRIVLRQITDELMFEISELSGQTYVDRYASRGGRGRLDKPRASRLAARSSAA